MTSQSLSTPPPSPVEEESDFSARKIRISLVVLLGTMFGSTTLPLMAIGLLLLPMTQEFGWSRTEFSGGQTAMMLAGACASPLLGRMVDRLGVRRMILLGTLVVALVVIGMSRLDGQLWQFYAAFALLGVTGTTAIGYSKVIGSLFTRHRGKALAIFGVESSVAMAFMPPMILWMITSLGWRGMFVGMGLVILATVPISYFFLPEPDAPGAPAESGQPVSSDRLPGLTVPEILRDRSFWLIAIASLLAIGPAFGLMPHFLPYLTERGFNAASLGWVLTAMTIAMAAGTIIGGWATDHAKRAWIAAPFSLLTTLALVCFMLMSASFGGVPLLIFAMSLLGFAGGAQRPMGTYFQIRFFGLKSFGALTGIQSPFLALGMGLAPLAVGWCYDHYGSYQPAFLVMALCMAITVLLYAVLGPYRYAPNLAAEIPVEEEGAPGEREISPRPSPSVA